MPTSLNVLLIERRPEAGAANADALEAAGHRVTRCYARPGPVGARVPARDRFLCMGVTSGRCPLDTGVDVALLVRDRIATEPSAREGGVACAIRAGVPVLEDGPDLLDPYAPWLAGRVENDVVAACHRVRKDSFSDLQEEIRRRIGPLLSAVAVDPEALAFRFEPDGPRLRIAVTGPPAGTGFGHALSVRVLDAIRDSGRTFGQVDVSYDTPGAG